MYVLIAYISLFVYQFNSIKLNSELKIMMSTIKRVTQKNKTTPVVDLPFTKPTVSLDFPIKRLGSCLCFVRLAPARMRKRFETFAQTLNDLMEPGLSSRLRKTKRGSAFCQQSPSHLNSQNKRISFG